MATEYHSVNCTVVNNNNPTVPFRWRDRNGVFHSVKDMDTNHLFNVLRMIWNHAVPEGMKILPYHRYTFGKFYTPQYMKDAIRYMAKELSGRTDLRGQNIKYLDDIRNKLKEYGERRERIE